MDNKEMQVNKGMGFDPALLRRFRVIFIAVTIISLICCFIPVAGCSKTDRVDKLIQELKDGGWNVRSNAAEALVKIGTSAVEPLLAALKDEKSDARWYAVEALGKIKDARAVKPLIAALKAKDLAVIAGDYSFFIRRGEYGSEPVLIDALNKYGGSKMATDFFNCGNSQLKKAAKEHGCIIIIDGGCPQWGSNK
ncbi:HEAT repeat domain-containing protein [bacterium]|nr:HEAT repeat domain-containing protein [bacterium]MBU1752327.1 HEAT repeat domain-containing protein [bacterium]